MLSWEYTPHLVGGLGKHVVELIPALIDEEIEIHLVTPRFKGGEPEEPLRGVEHAAPPQVVELEEELMEVPAGGPISNNSRVYRVNPHPYQIGNFFTNTVQTNVLLEQAGQQLFTH